MKIQLAKKSDVFKNRVSKLYNNINHFKSQIVLQSHLDEALITIFLGDMSN